MTPEAAKDRLRATAEELYNSRHLDLFERETREQIRMDRAERKARERGKTRNFSEVQIERRANTRRVFRKLGEVVGSFLIGIGLKKAKSEADKYL